MLLHFILREYAADDAYIHLRIAENFYNYGLPYYNLSAPVNGSSSNLWIFILIALHALPFDSIMLLSLLNGLLLTLLMFKVHEILDNKIYTLIAVSPFYAITFQQMESNLACLLLFWGFERIISKKPYALFFFTLAACTRLEFTVILIAYTSYLLLKDRKNILKELALSAIPAAIVLAYNLYYFHAIFPHTVQAKSIVYSINHELFTEQFSKMISVDPYFFYRKFHFFALLAAFLYSFRFFNKNKLINLSLLLTSGGAAILAVFYLKGVMIFPWYLAVVFGPLVLGLLFISRQASSPLLLAFSFFACFPFLKAMFFNIESASGNAAHYADYLRSARTRQYLAVGSVFNNICPECSLMAPEIGGLGQTFKGKIVDAVGLITPEALAFHPLPVPQARFSGSVGAVPARFVESARPDLIISLGLFLKDFRNSHVCSKYQAVLVRPFVKEDDKNLTGQVLWGSEALIVLLNKEEFTEQMITGIASLLKENSEDVKIDFNCKSPPLT